MRAVVYYTSGRPPIECCDKSLIAEFVDKYIREGGATILFTCIGSEYPDPTTISILDKYGKTQNFRLKIELREAFVGNYRDREICNLYICGQIFQMGTLMSNIKAQHVHILYESKCALLPVIYLNESCKNFSAETLEFTFNYQNGRNIKTSDRDFYDLCRYQNGASACIFFLSNTIIAKSLSIRMNIPRINLKIWPHIEEVHIHFSQKSTKISFLSLSPSHQKILLYTKNPIEPTNGDEIQFTNEIRNSALYKILKIKSLSSGNEVLTYQFKEGKKFVKL